MCVCVCFTSVCVCVCCRSTRTGLFGCQLQSALTCASNVVYCPNRSPEEHLRRPLKFKAIYHHLPPPPPPPQLPSSLTPSYSFSPNTLSLSPPSLLLLPVSLLSLHPSYCCFSRIKTQIGLMRRSLIFWLQHVVEGVKCKYYST